MPELRLLDAIREAMYEEMKRDARVVVLGEDVGPKGGVFGATDGFAAEFGDARVLDTPLAESTIVGAAIGMAVNGLIPIAEIQFSDFIFPATNQIVSEAARMRYRSNGAFGCPIVIRAPYGGGVEVHGGLYHSQSIEAFFSHVPGLKVVAPSTPYDAKGLLKAAIRDPDPVLYLEHKRLYRAVRGEVPDADYVVPIGLAVVRRPGTTLSLFAYGQMLHDALAVAAEVAGEGIDVEVVDLQTLRPLDVETILASVRRTNKALIVYEDNRFMGFGAEVAALIAEEAFDALDGPVMRVAGLDVPAVPYADPLAAAFMPSRAKIADAVRRLAAY
ncbi:MAG: alpha-ketoacid dehydrogenase subunit beta [Armatimonadota bacterium]|nr:alpha-ketoacid dehydrogenase subunit beta [Armatimonadota bacterium]MDR7533452.1 alpha-ketoacid dehydrogenase subunit beta [Armatimonadota bacterium]MDR7536265.1 alpha-ketoacid dehydrogenase subunit beta [Armatimonadota bacterium]